MPSYTNQLWHFVYHVRTFLICCKACLPLSLLSRQIRIFIKPKFLRYPLLIPMHSSQVFHSHTALHFCVREVSIYINTTEVRRGVPCGVVRFLLSVQWRQDLRQLGRGSLNVYIYGKPQTASKQYQQENSPKKDSRIAHHQITLSSMLTLYQSKLCV